MKWKWAAALLLLPGLSAASSRAAGFGFTITNATVVNNDATPNGKADVGDSFSITNAALTSYLSSGDAPSIDPSIGDLSRYSVSVNASVDKVTGSDTAHYAGTFAVRYTSPEYPAGLDVETGTVDLTAVYDSAGGATVRGLFNATPGVTNAAFKDFAPYNPGRFFGKYAPNAGGATGTLTGSLNGGQEGFLATISEATLSNQDTNSNGHADVGETFTLSAPLASYWPTAPDAMLPLKDNDLSRYTVILNGTVAAIAGRTVDYTGTFAIRYTGPAYPAGVDVETGDFTLRARFNELVTASAKLTGTFIAKAGVPAAIQADANLGNTDFAVFNPATFSGTYTPDTVGGASGKVSGSLYGGVVGFSASLANGAVANGDENHDGNADVGETFTADVPLAAYLAVGAPELLDKDLSRYRVNLQGNVASISGTDVNYAGSFRIIYTGPAVPGGIDIETGSFAITADFAAGDGSAELSGTLTAFAGPATNTPPFDETDYAPFGDAVFTGHYAPIGAGATGTLRGSLIAGSNVEPLVARKVGATIEGSVTAAVNTNDDRLAIVASGTTLYVIDPATGDDAPNWKGGKTLDGKVIGRAAVIRDEVFVGTDNGTLYHFNLISGTQPAGSAGSGQPGGAGSKIYTAPAPADSNNDGIVDAVYLSISKPGGSSEVVKVLPGDLNTAVSTFVMSGATTVSSPAVSGAGTVFVGSNNGLYSLNAADLTPKLQATGKPVPTSPFIVGPAVFVGVGDGTTLQALDSSTGNVIGSQTLASPLQVSVFYESRTGLLLAGLADGRIFGSNQDASFSNYVLPGLFNQENTGGSFSMPVQANGILYRATEKSQIISGVGPNGDNQQTIDLISKSQGAVAATSQTPGADFILATSPDGYLHAIGVR